jgi:hypothetical protein
LTDATVAGFHKGYDELSIVVWDYETVEGTRGPLDLLAEVEGRSK